MNATPKKKLCWNCEASVALHEENCPYCAVYLGPASVSGEESNNDPLAPPYKIQVMEGEEEELPEAPYATEAAREEEEEEYDALESTGDIKEVAIPTSLLLTGTVFFLFGLVLFLFSTNGVFTLRWNGEYWYLYQIAAIPMLYFGWRSLNQIGEAEPVAESEDYDE